MGTEGEEIPGVGFTPPMGARRQDRFDTCGFNPSMIEGEECGKPATWHIIWTLDGENGSACDEHHASSTAAYVCVCSHRRGPDCMMPGSFILWPPENRCVVDGDPIDGPVLEAEQAL